MNVSWLREGGPTDIFPCELVCVSVIISGFSVFRCARAQIGCSSQEWKIPTFLFFENQSEKILLFRLHFFDHYIKVECFSTYLLAIYSFISDELLDYLS